MCLSHPAVISLIDCNAKNDNIMGIMRVPVYVHVCVCVCVWMFLCVCVCVHARVC